MMSIYSGQRRGLALLLAVLLLFCTGCQRAAKMPEAAPAQVSALTGEDLSAAVVYAPGAGNGWQETLASLENSTLANLTAAAVTVEDDLTGYDLLAADASLGSLSDWAACREKLMAYVSAGGMLVVDNALWDRFPLDFLGIAGGEALVGAPTALSFPEVQESLAAFQGVLQDFAALYPAYYNAEALAELDYGVAFVPDGAEVLAAQGDLALYTLHNVGEGQVLLANPLLPNTFSITSPSLERLREGQAPFANTTASANRLFYGKLLAYIALEKYGYAVERVYGSFGTNPLAWELHYEDITAVANGSCYQFADLAVQAGQIPSFSLVRDFYWWFLRAESVTYLTNQSMDGGLDFAMDEVENAYASGTHVLSDGGWLSQVWVENTISYFDDTGGYDQRAYPCLYDLDGDGRLDLLTGSSDGQIRFYQGLSNENRFAVGKAQAIGTIACGYSAPAILDIDGDGMADIVSGGGDGRLYWFRGTGGMSFAPMGELGLSLGWGETQVFPAAGDIDGDGVTDLAVGSANGQLAVFYGERGPDGTIAFLRQAAVELPEEVGDWAAPCIWDLDGDGRMDIALGTFHGYIARLLQTGSGFRFEGFLQGPEQNYKGNFYLKFGNNCVPAFGDVNDDGAADLICGQLEYGLGYPIDSEYFPYRQELQEQIDWMKASQYYICSHALTHQYASQGYEEREFARQWEALSGYGVDLSGTGTNQHTWHTSGEGPSQTFSAQYRQGMLWNSGAELPQSGATPQISAENVLCLPFFLEEGEEKTMLLLNASTLFYRGEDWAAASARYGVPVLMYYHCDMIYKSDSEARQAIQTVSDFLGTHDYMCVREDQLAYAAAAALNTQVTAGRDGDVLRLSAQTIRQDLAMYDETFQAAVGVKVTFAGGAEGYTTDASVWRRMGNSLYLSLDKDVSVWRGDGSGSHLRRVNVPAEITWNGGDLTIAFTQGGMMQAEVEGTVSTPCEGWTMTRTGENTLFTRFGGPAELVLHLW